MKELHCADNLTIMNNMESESIDLILNPPQHSLF